jgi:hypothetical protein
MKRYLIGSLVGAILVFGWQSVAHMFMHHHDAAYMPVPNQESVINSLSTMFKEEGQYLIPRSDPNASEEEMQKYDEGMKGKPWAMVTYHPSYENNMGTAILRSFVTALISVLLFIWIMGRNQDDRKSIFLKCIAYGFAMFMFVWYNQNIWMQTPWDVLKGELIDLLVAWGLCGAWLSWYLRRKESRKRKNVAVA